MKRVAWFACALLLPQALAFAAPREGLTGFVQKIYASYARNGRGIDIHGAAAASVLASSLIALIKADDKAAKGGIGALDFDPLCACQDFAITDVRLDINSVDRLSARVDVHFRNFDTQQSVVLDIVETPAGWRITDIATKEVPSLVALLRRSGSRKAAPRP